MDGANPFFRVRKPRQRKWLTPTRQMSQHDTQTATDTALSNHEVTDDFGEFFRTYYREEIATLAQRYPSEQQSLAIEYGDLFQFSVDLANDWREHPEQVREFAEEALRLFDLPADVSLPNAHVRLCGLPEEHAYYPGGYSIDEHPGDYLAIEGEVVASSDVYARVTVASFECSRCGTMTRIPQTGEDDEFQEPHECQGCERQGPFNVNLDNSDRVRAQKFRVSEPPEVAGGEGQIIDVYVEDDLAGVVETGDRLTVSGVLHLTQVSKGRQKTAKFEAYLDGESIEVDETDHNKIDITPDERTQIKRLANGEEGTPLALAADSLAPKIVGYDYIKRMCILQMVGGERITNPDGSTDRGAINMLLLGDPGTTKSKLVSRVTDIAPRAVPVSGKGAREAGITASAVRDDFGEGEWTLKAGAFVKANGGLVCIDELDDMPEEVRSSMLEPMANGSININKAGINAQLNTRVGVIAAGNPKHGRWDGYQDMAEQFDFDSALLSRFDIIYTLKDKPDPDRDEEIAGHIARHRELSKRYTKDSTSLSDEEEADVKPPVDGEILTKWIALAKRQPAPTFANDSIRQSLVADFAEIRGMNGYNENSPIPTTFRKLEAILRVAEAAAKLEFSETIEQRHVNTAMDAVKQSMQDYGQDEDGNFDTDIIETGQSMNQKERLKTVVNTLRELLEDIDQGGVEMPTLIEELSGAITEEHVRGDVQKLRDKGDAYEPKQGEIRLVDV